MQTALAGRPIADYRQLTRPEVLPAELVFKEGDSVPTRKATEAWFAWAMKNSAFFYIGAGDLMKSILTGKAENVYGVMNPRNPLGRGIRFGIAEQNMAMMSCAIAQDVRLPPVQRLRHLRRLHLHDGELRAHDAHQ
jgi:transketolase